MMMMMVLIVIFIAIMIYGYCNDFCCYVFGGRCLQTVSTHSQRVKTKLRGLPRARKTTCKGRAAILGLRVQIVQVRSLKKRAWGP